MPENVEKWHVDKGVPVARILATILVMTGQMAVIVWGAAVMFKDVESNRRGLMALDARVSSIDRASNQQAVQLGRIEENILGIRSDINRFLVAVESGRKPYNNGGFD